MAYGTKKQLKKTVKFIIVPCKIPCSPQLFTHRSRNLNRSMAAYADITSLPEMYQIEIRI
ncbi:hypothetical protein C5167_038707 [Papaver somniferum]|uniref:Uncharacterized protein n=1 Tax=Papaver somniferum TaxID=3469 RepID=A0A4Y7IDN2_PAPSO|nr:hypothetical protein C5167_038707 [Papaver somniferum]